MKLRLTAGHPRLYITPKDLPKFRKLSLLTRKSYRTALLKWLEPITQSLPALRARIPTDSPEQQALAIGQAWRLTGDERYGRAARWLLESLEHGIEAHSWGYDAWGLAAEAAAMLYDWLHDYWNREGLEEIVARATLYCTRRALDESLRQFIVDDWHNYYLGLQSGALAGALAIGYDHPKLEDGTVLRTLHALHFTGLKSDALWLQDLYHVPKTVRCLSDTLAAGKGTGFAGHLEASGAYHTVDALEFIKMAEWWTSAAGADTSVCPDGIVWPEVIKGGESFLHFSRPGDERCIIHGDAGRYRPHMRPAIILTHLQARTPRPEFAEWLAQHPHLSDNLTPMDALLFSQPLPRSKQKWSEGLPTAALFDPVAVLRSSWKDDATLVTFRCGRHGGWHNHLDHNSFTIFRGGALAIDSGGIEYAGTHRPEYAMRTLAHNAILVRNPKERHWLGRLAMPTGNDGGQRIVPCSYNPPNRFTGKPHAIITEERRKSLADEFDMGQIVAFKPGEAFDYVAGDATRAYTYPWSGVGDNPSRRVEEAVRQIVFLKPDLVVIFDRVEATRAQFEKTWLLHAINAPTYFLKGRARKVPRGIHALPSNGPFEFTQERGRLTVFPMLPEASQVRAIGGKGFECWVEHAVGAERGKNYPAPATQAETGAWRIEIAPKKKQLRDCFLTVLHAGMSREAPARQSIHCVTEVENDTVKLIVNRKSRPIATLRFNSTRLIVADVDFAGAQRHFSAPAPKRVPHQR